MSEAAYAVISPYAVIFPDAAIVPFAVPDIAATLLAAEALIINGEKLFVVTPLK